MADTALIVCGALAREVIAIKNKYSWQVDVLALPALLHNSPERIPGAVKKRIHALRQDYQRLIVVYGDCGTAGVLDRVLDQEDVRRIRGPHCYEMYADGTFERMMAEEPGTYFLTDYLLRSFDHLVLEGLGLDRFPGLRDDYFGNYRRVVYLAQRLDPALVERAHWAADCLGLPLEIRDTGYGQLETRLRSMVEASSTDNE